MYKIRTRHTNRIKKQLSLNSPTHILPSNRNNNHTTTTTNNTLPRKPKPYTTNSEIQTIYTCKDKAETHFSKKIRNIIETDESLKNLITSSSSTFNSTKRKDKWKPKGYLYYDFFLKHPLLTQSEGKLPNITLHDIKHRHTRSNVFPLQNAYTHVDTETIPSNHRMASIRYTDSDILNMKNDSHILKRSSETYALKQRNNKRSQHVLTTTTESQSDWIPKQLQRLSLMNHTSVKYNVISPSHKSNSLTKDAIKRSLSSNGNNNGDGSSSNDMLFYKVNSVSEFVDLTRVSAPNLNKAYTHSLRECGGVSPFARTNEVGTTYQDMHHTYRELFKKPFWK
jgi:hypothetical protein